MRRATPTIVVALTCMCTVPEGFGQTITVDPSTTTSIEGEDQLDRKKYFSLAADAGPTLDAMDAERFDRYFRDLEITLGRRVNILSAGANYENVIFEDPNRPGRVDIERLAREANPPVSKWDAELREIFPDGPDLVATENFHRNTWPTFMETYVREEDTTGHHPMVKDADAAAEGMMAYLEHMSTDWGEPRWFEGLNEPDWFFNVNNDASFFDLHRHSQKYAKTFGIDTHIGGPCFPTAQYFNLNYQMLRRSMGHFIDQTDCGLEFYSFHPYDYMNWNEEAHDFTGRITGGLPMNADLDALVNYTVNEHGKPIKVVISEHGAYMWDTAVRDEQMDRLTEELFPDLSTWDREMKRRDILSFLMVNGAISHTLSFMDHPHTVEKAIPYIQLQAASWKVDHYAVLLVSKDYAYPVEEWIETRMVDFWEFFKDVDGRRVAAWGDDPDVQVHAFAEDDKVYVLMNNLAPEPQSVTLDLADGERIEAFTVRRLGRNEDFTPNFTTEVVESLDDLTLAVNESVALVVDYDGPIEEARWLDETVHYGDKSCVEFEGDDVVKFNVAVPNPTEAEYAILRIAVGRPTGTDHDIAVRLNGQLIDMPMEDAASILDGGNRPNQDYYGALKRVRVPAVLLQAENTVELSWPDGKSGGVGSVVLRVARPVD